MTDPIDPIDVYFKQMLNSLCETLKSQTIYAELIRQSTDSFLKVIWTYQKYLDSKNIFNSDDVIFDENTFK